MNKLADILDQLLEKHSFDELTSEQQQLVLSEMTHEEYTQMQRIVSSTTALGQEGRPPLPQRLQENLRQEFRSRHGGQKSSVAQNWRAPLLGAVLGVLATTGYFWLSAADTLQPAVETTPIIPLMQTDTVYIEKTDTVYLTETAEPKLITKEVVKYIEREIPAPVVQPPRTTVLPLAYESEPQTNNQLQDTLQGNYFNNIDLADIIPIKVGKTVGEETELMDLLREMPSDGLENE